MMLLDEVTEQRPGAASRSLKMTHTVTKQGGTRTIHTIRFYEPDKPHGPLAGKLLVGYVLDAEQARELKANLLEPAWRWRSPTAMSRAGANVKI
jgi:hypothetical protein